MINPTTEDAVEDRRIDVLRAIRRGGRLRVARRLLRAVSVALMFGIPDGLHSLDAVEDSVVLLTVVKLR